MAAAHRIGVGGGDAVGWRASTERTASIGRRIRRIREHLGRARIEYQASLFDRRDEADRSAREQSLARLHEALARTESAIGRHAPDGSRIVLVAAWPERPW